VSIIGAKGGSAGGYEIANSLRFRASASAYLSRTPASAGNRKTWTWSGWVKYGILPSATRLFMQRSVNTDSGWFSVNWITGNALEIQLWNHGIKTSQVFRDHSAWGHLLVVVDTTQATTTNRVKLYWNGNQINYVTSFGSGISGFSQNLDTAVNSTALFTLGASFNPGDFLDGYLSEINFIDGQALTPSSFGETNADGVWTPKKYAGTYGTNGFYLDFSDGTSTTTLGYDAAGSNDWTCNNISLTAGVTYDWMTDTPTNNYATLTTLPITPYPATLARANLQGTTTSGAGGGNAYGTIAIPDSGQWYFEVVASSLAANLAVGISTYVPSQNYAYQATDGVFYLDSGNKQVDNSNSAYGASWTTSDVIGVAIDASAGSVTFYKNNSSQGSISHACAGRFVSLGDGSSGAVTSIYDINFGQRPFSYTPPTGFKALCTANLPAVTITKPKSHFDTLIYSGNGGTQTITGLNFTSDFIWIKERSTNVGGTGAHRLYDSQRGPFGYWLSSNSTAAETASGTLGAVNSTGFTVGTDNDLNDSGGTYVGWAWKANGAGSSNTAGSITSTVSANTTAGFSVVNVTLSGSAPFNFGHGLGAVPSMFIAKRQDGTSPLNWHVYHKNMNTTPQNGRLLLNTTDAYTADSGAFGNTAPTSSVIYLGSNFSASTKIILYCFAEIPGYSKFGSYTGNGSADGPFVFCGFRPKFVMVKRTDSSTYGNWEIIDTVRDPYNHAFNDLIANLSNAENVDGAGWDILSNGFKCRDGSSTGNKNVSGGTYIFAAFAEHPFGGSNVSPSPAR